MAKIKGVGANQPTSSSQGEDLAAFRLRLQKHKELTASQIELTAFQIGELQTTLNAFKDEMMAEIQAFRALKESPAAAVEDSTPLKFGSIPPIGHSTGLENFQDSAALAQAMVSSSPSSQRGESPPYVFAPPRPPDPPYPNMYPSQHQYQYHSVHYPSSPSEQWVLPSYPVDSCPRFTSSEMAFGCDPYEPPTWKEIRSVCSHPPPQLNPHQTPQYNQYYTPSMPSQPIPQFHTTHSVPPLHYHITHSICSPQQPSNHLFYNTTQHLQHQSCFNSPNTQPPVINELPIIPTKTATTPTIYQSPPPPSTDELQHRLANPKLVKPDHDQFHESEVPFVGSSYPPSSLEPMDKIEESGKCLSPKPASGKLSHKEHLCELRKSLQSSHGTFMSELKEELRLLRGSCKSQASQVNTTLKLSMSTTELVPPTTTVHTSVGSPLANVASIMGNVLRTSPGVNLNLNHTYVDSGSVIDVGIGSSGAIPSVSSNGNYISDDTLDSHYDISTVMITESSGEDVIAASSNSFGNDKKMGRMSSTFPVYGSSVSTSVSLERNLCTRVPSTGYLWQNRDDTFKLGSLSSKQNDPWWSLYGKRGGCNFVESKKIILENEFESDQNHPAPNLSVIVDALDMSTELWPSATSGPIEIEGELKFAIVYHPSDFRSKLMKAEEIYGSVALIGVNDDTGEPGVIFGVISEVGIAPVASSLSMISIAALVSSDQMTSRHRESALDGLWDDRRGLTTMKITRKSFCKPSLVFESCELIPDAGHRFNDHKKSATVIDLSQLLLDGEDFSQHTSTHRDIGYAFTDEEASVSVHEKWLSHFGIFPVIIKVGFCFCTEVHHLTTANVSTGIETTSYEWGFQKQQFRQLLMFVSILESSFIRCFDDPLLSIDHGLFYMRNIKAPEQIMIVLASSPCDQAMELFTMHDCSLDSHSLMLGYQLLCAGISVIKFSIKLNHAQTCSPLSTYGNRDVCRAAAINQILMITFEGKLPCKWSLEPQLSRIVFFTCKYESDIHRNDNVVVFLLLSLSVRMQWVSQIILDNGIAPGLFLFVLVINLRKGQRYQITLSIAALKLCPLYVFVVHSKSTGGLVFAILLSGIPLVKCQSAWLGGSFTLILTVDRDSGKVGKYLVVTWLLIKGERELNVMAVLALLLKMMLCDDQLDAFARLQLGSGKEIGLSFTGLQGVLWSGAMILKHFGLHPRSVLVMMILFLQRLHG